MSAILVPVDEATQKRLEFLSSAEGTEVPDMASRILRRAVRSSRIRRHFDPQQIAAANKGFEQEDLELAESDARHRFELLQAEDSA